MKNDEAQQMGCRQDRFGKRIQAKKRTRVLQLLEGTTELDMILFHIISFVKALQVKDLVVQKIFGGPASQGLFINKESVKMYI